VQTRRAIVIQGLSAAALLAPTKYAAAACVDESNVITRERYEKYIALYNKFDLAFLDYYADDVTLDMMPPIKGRDAAMAFFKDMRSYVVDTIQVGVYVADQTGIAAQLTGEFHCVRDMPGTALSGLFGRSVKKGQVRRQQGTILYGVEKAKIKSITPSPPITLQDWT
jgi:ketosteroid isomerase-like protein